MAIEYLGLTEINGPLVVLDGLQDAAFEEIVEITAPGGEVRTGRIIEIQGERAIVQVFENTSLLSLQNTKTRLTGKPMMMPLSKEI